MLRGERAKQQDKGAGANEKLGPDIENWTVQRANPLIHFEKFMLCKEE